MFKLSVLFVLALGVIFAQTVSAYTVRRESDDKDASIEYDDDEILVYEGDEEEPESPTLACFIFGDLGCNLKCSIAASAFSTSGSGKCSAENVCQCDIQSERLFSNLFNYYFENSNYALNRIKSNPNVLMKVKKILKKPYQTAGEVKAQLLGIVDSETFDRMYSRNQTPADKMFDECYNLDTDKIKEYVGEKIKPELKSLAQTLKGIDYKKKLSEVLKENADDDELLQSLMDEVHRTENRHLNGVLKLFLQLNRNIRENPSEKQDTIVDAVGYYTVDQIANEIDQLNRPAFHKSNGRQPPRKNISNGRSKPQAKRTSKPKKFEPVEIPPSKEQNPTEKVTKKESNASETSLPTD